MERLDFPLLKNGQKECFSSTYTKTEIIQRRLAWPLCKDDTQIREVFHKKKKKDRKKGEIGEKTPICVSSLRFCVQSPTTGGKNPESSNFSPHKILLSNKELSVTTSASTNPG